MNVGEDFESWAVQLRPFYRRFLEAREGQLLFTGHSHQAWPDVSREAQLAAWDDAAAHVDGKWSYVLGELYPRFQAQVAARIGTRRAESIALAPNSHELVYRLLSCFPPTARVLTSGGEFFSMRRQLHRLAEDGLELVEVTPGPRFLERMQKALAETKPDLVCVSSVFFETAEHFAELPLFLAAAAAAEVPCLVDAYHAFNVVPFAVDSWPGEVFVTAGGYKYAQAGEGAAWLLLSAGAERFRPRQTGWFSDFSHLEAGGTAYGPDAYRFFGATFDPSGLYRAERVLRFFDERGLDLPQLRAISLAQTEHMIERFDTLGLERHGLELATPRDPQRRGGFLSFRFARAAELQKRAAARGLFTDARGPFLRLGPAPYTRKDEIDRAFTLLHELLR